MGGWFPALEREGPTPEVRANLSSYMCSELGWRTSGNSRHQPRASAGQEMGDQTLTPTPGSTHSKKVCVKESVFWGRERDLWGA